MKNMMKWMLSAAVMTACGTLAAQEKITCNTAADWNKNPAVSDVDGVINVKKRVVLTGKRFDIDPSKHYILNLSCRAQNLKNENDTSMVCAGFKVFDQNGRQISSLHSKPLRGTLTEVVEDAPAGAVTLKIKDGSKFKTSYFSIVTDAKADLSDLPNFNVIGSPKSVVRKGEVWEIVLPKPLSREIKAGTVVREHQHNGDLYTAGIKQVGKEWTAMSGSITGMKRGSWDSKVWPAGAAQAQIVIVVNAGRKSLDTQIKEVSLTVK